MEIPRSGFAGAVACTPSACSRSITPFQLEASAKAPCTSTTVGELAVRVVSDMCVPFAWQLSVDDRDEWLSLFDDIGGEFRCDSNADVLHRVDRSGRDEQHVAGMENHRRPAVDQVLQRPFEDVDHLFTG